jgi:hypothetical protein
MGDGEVIRRRACGGSGYGKIVCFEFEDGFEERVVSGVVSGLRRTMGICAVYKSRRSSWDSSRVGRSSVRRAGKGRDAKKEDDKCTMPDDEGCGSPGLFFVSLMRGAAYLWRD